MFSGIQEILLIAAILLGIFFIPRMLKPQPPARKTGIHRPALQFSWKLRLALVISVLWPIACALHFKPWRQDAIPFAAIGIGPVLIAWSLKWVLAGMKNKR